MVYFIVMFFSCGPFVSAQINDVQIQKRYYGIATGMGVMLINAPDVVDYLNTSYPTPTKLDDFGLGAVFFGETSMQISDSWNLKIEYTYLIKSYNIPQPPLPDYSFKYEIHMPALIAQYMILGENYILKIGGGSGYHFATFSQTIMNNDKRYWSKGLGVKFVVEANTAFDDSFYGYVAGEIQNNFMSEFIDANEKKVVILGSSESASMDFFGLGLKFGVCYYF